MRLTVLFLSLFLAHFAHARCFKAADLGTRARQTDYLTNDKGADLALTQATLLEDNFDECELEELGLFAKFVKLKMGEEQKFIEKIHGQLKPLLDQREKNPEDLKLKVQVLELETRLAQTVGKLAQWRLSFHLIQERQKVLKAVADGEDKRAELD